MAKRSKLLGTRFPGTLAESLVEWKVKESLPGDVYLCEVVGDSELAGTETVFTREAIEAALTWDAFSANEWRKHEDFYESLKPGDVVHYAEGDRHVRCEVVVASGLRAGVDHYCLTEGETCLRMVALVGRWSERDLLPGSYYATRVAAQGLFKPNATCVWEFSPQGTDPRQMPAL